MDKKMTREFIETRVFEKRWKELNLTDEDLRQLQNYIMKNPEAGDIIKESGGAVKLRWALPGKGKRGGIRVIYIDFIRLEQLYFLTCYPKSEKTDLSPGEKAIIKQVIRRITENERRVYDER